MTKLINQNYAIRFFGFLLWGMGINSKYFFPLIPLGSILFIVGVLFRISQLISGSRNDNQINITLSNFLGEYIYLAFKGAVWFTTIVLIFAMSTTSINGFNKITDDIFLNSIKPQLDVSPTLDSKFGILRKYSSPEWIVEDSTIRIAKIYTNGKSAYGSFILIIDSKNESLQIDSLFVNTE